MADDPMISVPLATVEAMAQTPMRLAQLDANELLRRGDIAGASRRLADAAIESAATRARLTPPTPAAAAASAVTAAPAPTVPLAAPGSPLPAQPPVPPQNMGEAAVAWVQAQRAAMPGGGDPLRDTRLPFGLGRR